MDSKTMIVMIIDSQNEILEKAKKAIMESDFVTFGILLAYLGSIHEKVAKSIMPFAILQYAENEEETKRKRNAAETFIKEYHKQMEVMLDDIEGLSN